MRRCCPVVLAVVLCAVPLASRAQTSPDASPPDARRTGSVSPVMHASAIAGQSAVFAGVRGLLPTRGSASYGLMVETLVSDPVRQPGNVARQLSMTFGGGWYEQRLLSRWGATLRWGTGLGVGVARWSAPAVAGGASPADVYSQVDQELLLGIPVWRMLHVDLSVGYRDFLGWSLPSLPQQDMHRVTYGAAFRFGWF